MDLNYMNLHESIYGKSIHEILQRDWQRDDWEKLHGLDPNNQVWCRRGMILKITSIEKFYALMLKDALADIHSALAPLKVVPALLWITYKEPYLITGFEKLEEIGTSSAFAIGMTLAKAHCGLENIPVRKTYPWIGFYGEPHEFKMLIPHVKDTQIRTKAKYLLSKITIRNHTNLVHYIHRDMNPSNVINTKNGVFLIDWDMAHGGYRIDDVAMAICCLAQQDDTCLLMDFYSEFIEGYRQYIRVDWADCSSAELLSAIALAGLRQAVAGWFTDKGDLSGLYWPNILKRLDTAIELCKTAEA